MCIRDREEAGNTQQQQQRRRGPEASRGAREEEKKENGMPELTVRAQDMNERMTQHIGNARWMRVIYRQIDLTKEQNAPLYYPTQPVSYTHLSRPSFGRHTGPSGLYAALGAYRRQPCLGGSLGKR